MRAIHSVSSANDEAPLLEIWGLVEILMSEFGKRFGNIQLFIRGEDTSVGIREKKLFRMKTTERIKIPDDLDGQCEELCDKAWERAKSHYSELDRIQFMAYGGVLLVFCNGMEKHLMFKSL